MVLRNFRFKMIELLSHNTTLSLNNRRREALHHGDLKIVRQKGEPRQFYDLADDPTEQTDLAEQQPGRVEALVGLYRAERAEDKDE